MWFEGVLSRAGDVSDERSQSSCEEVITISGLFCVGSSSSRSRPSSYDPSYVTCGFAHRQGKRGLSLFFYDANAERWIEIIKFLFSRDYVDYLRQRLPSILS